MSGPDFCMEMLYNPESLVSTELFACHRKEQEEIQNTVVVYLWAVDFEKE